MAKYSDIKGFTVQTVSSDPAASGLAGGSWASGGTANTARRWAAQGSVGTQTATLIIGGGPPTTDAVELYNGSSWTEISELNEANSSQMGIGTSTSALSVGAYTNNESWNGSSWTELAEINNPRYGGGSAGVSNTSGMIFGGENPSPAGPHPGPYFSATETWNGSAWTEVNEMNQARYGLSSGGTVTAALGSGGGDPVPSYGKYTEIWDGSSWTETTDMNERRMLGGSVGISTDLLAVGSDPGGDDVGATEHWNGSAWTELTEIATSRGQMSSGGTSSAGIIATGRLPPGPVTAVSEEWSLAPVTSSMQIEGQLYFNSTTNTFKETIFDVSAGTWASGGALNNARYGGYAVGASNSDNLNFSGYTTTYVNYSESYNGTAWTEVNEVNTALYNPGGGGIVSTAVVKFGGNNGSGNNNSTESWNGSSWTEVNEINTARRGFGSFGSSTSAIGAGGYSTTTVNNVEQWDGTNWTEITELNAANTDSYGAGADGTAGIIFGGGSPHKATTEEWNGTSWTEVGDLNLARQFLDGAGLSSTQALAFGGENPPPNTNDTEAWNGTSWTEVSNLPSGRAIGSGGGTGLSCLSSAFQPPGTGSTTTSEWQVNLGNKTITSS